MTTTCPHETLALAIEAAVAAARAAGLGPAEIANALGFEAGWHAPHAALVVARAAQDGAWEALSAPAGKDEWMN